MILKPGNGNKDWSGYLLITFEEGGNSLRFLTNEELTRLLNDPLYYGADSFLSSSSQWNTLDEANLLPNEVLLMKVEVVTPEIVTQVTSYRLPKRY